MKLCRALTYPFLLQIVSIKDPLKQHQSALHTTNNLKLVFFLLPNPLSYWIPLFYRSLRRRMPILNSR